jgi:predicted transcriptional regulator
MSSNKQLVRDLLDRLPDEASLLDIAREVEFLDGIREGLEQADRGEYVSADGLRADLRQWAHSK